MVTALWTDVKNDGGGGDSRQFSMVVMWNFLWLLSFKKYHFCVKDPIRFRFPLLTFVLRHQYNLEKEESYQAKIMSTVRKYQCMCGSFEAQVTGEPLLAVSFFFLIVWYNFLLLISVHIC